MATELEFCLLGPITVRVDGVPVAVPAGKQRAVLAALLLNVGRVVSLDELAEVLWTDPPPSVQVTIRNHVKRLRQTLGPAAGCRIGTEPSGYLIRVEAGELDVSRFEAHLDAVRAAVRDGAWETAACEARAGLALWRGEPFADAESDVLAVREVPRRSELRLEAAEARIRADVELGRHGQVVAELRRLAAAYPMREQVHGQTGERRSGTVVISAIGGTAGVGKTALALHFAHQVADRFGDGQLYVNLRGFAASRLRGVRCPGHVRGGGPRAARHARCAA
jgi:DNA-binding SARP family transcriptional activator